MFTSHRLKTISPWAARSAFLIILCSGFAVFHSCSKPSLPPKSIEGLTQLIEQQAHVFADSQSYVWEPSQGSWSDYQQGRWLVFLAHSKVGSPRDVYRARIRLSPEGHPLQVQNIVNLTTTQESDEQHLVMSHDKNFVAFSSVAFGQHQSLTVFDLRGEGSAAKELTWSEKIMRAITNWQETGTQYGIGKLHINFDSTIQLNALYFRDQKLHIRYTPSSNAPQSVALDVANAEAIAPSSGLRLERAVHVPKRTIHWAVDTVRAVPWIGPKPIAWLEAKVWDLKDRAKRWKHGIGTKKSTEIVKSDVEIAEAMPRALDPSVAGEDGGYWPPQPVTTLFKDSEPGEGEWVPSHPEWMHKIPNAPPAFYRTFVRPDPIRPYSKIILVAMDTRQLDVDMEAGIEDPKPSVGSYHGAGRVPREANLVKRVVAAFNGGFKSEHGHYGMMVKKKILLPPVPNAATAIVTEDGRFGLGAWSPSREVPPEILSYRQNLDPLIDEGAINPRKRIVWGAVLMGQPKLTGQQTERSALCITRAKHLLYVWGDDVGPEAMAKAMQLASCDFGMHLDMNPYHTGFVFLSFEDAQYKTGQSEILTPLMAIGPRRYIDYNAKDFFYVLLRDVAPTKDNPNLNWVKDEGLQPQPQWLPAFLKATHPNGTQLTAIEPGRVHWALRAGQKEPIPKGIHDVPYTIEGELSKKVIASFGLGFSEANPLLGLTVQNKNLIPLNSSHASLVILNNQNLSIVNSNESMPTHATDLVQGPLIVNNGQYVDQPQHATHSYLRMAVGLTKDNRVVIAQGSFANNEPLAAALIEAGCVRAIGLRGQSSGSIARAGTQHPPMNISPQTTLFALAQPMLPRAFRFDRSSDGTPLWPAVTKAVP